MATSTTPQYRKHTERDLDALADALRKALVARGYSQTQLGDAIGATQSQVSTWVNGHYAPSPRLVKAIEQELNLKLGSLSKYLGFITVPDDHDPSDDVETAIAADPYLSPEQVDALLALYRHYRTEN